MNGMDLQDQRDVLFEFKHFIKGSIFIIMSRDNIFLKILENYVVHEVDFLKAHEVKKLICFHAFGLEPIMWFQKYDELPLTLEVVGAYLQDHITLVKVGAHELFTNCWGS